MFSRYYYMRLLAYHDHEAKPYLKSFDPDAFFGLGKIEYTTKRDEAMCFNNQQAVMKLWSNSILHSYTMFIESDNLDLRPPANSLPI